METLGDKKVVSSLGWAGEAYNPSHSAPRKAFSCTHSQIKWPGNTKCHTTFQEIFEHYLSSPPGFANSQLFFPDTTPKYTPLASATQIHNVRFWMGDSKPPPHPKQYPHSQILPFWQIMESQSLTLHSWQLKSKKIQVSKTAYFDIVFKTFKTFFHMPLNKFLPETSLVSTIKHPFFLGCSLPPRKKIGLLLHLFNFY